MPDYIKLTAPGSSETFKLARVELNTSGNFPDYLLHTDDGRIVQGPKSALDRQLPKCAAAAMEDLIGAYITVARSEKLGANKHPFWNLSVASGTEARAAEPSKRVTPPSAADAKARTGIPKPFEEDFDYDFPPEPPELTRAAPPAPRPVASRPATPAAPGVEAESDVDRYTNLMHEIAGLLGCPVTEANVQGAAATLWIGWHRR